MIDLSKTIAPKSASLTADDLLGGELTITITDVQAGPSDDQPVALRYDGDGDRPYLPCRIMRRVLVHVWGKDGHGYVGRSLTLYRDPEVKYGGMAVGGLRISHMSHITTPVVMALTATKANKKPFTVKPLVLKQPDFEPIDFESLLREAQSAANSGVERYQDFWRSLSAHERGVLLPEHNKLKADATNVDASNSQAGIST